jgi:predicted  nucleic acid-binding Zn-ribbon protein
MKAAPASQRALLDLARVDAEILRLNHRAAHLPEDAVLAELTKRHTAERDESVQVSMLVEDLDRDISRLENEVRLTRMREEKDRELMGSGRVGAKQLTELEHELRGLERRQSVLEDEELDLMEKREATALDQQRAEATVLATEEDIANARRRREEALADIEVARTRANDERATLAGAAPADLLAQYEKRRAAAGIGAGLLQARRCGACRLELDATFVEKVKAMLADEVAFCEECGAVLVRTDESGLG